MRNLRARRNVIRGDISHRLHAIRKGNDDNTNVLHHRQQHLAQCLDLRIAVSRGRGTSRSQRSDAAHPCHPFHKVSYGGIERRMQFFLVSIQIIRHRMKYSSGQRVAIYP